MKKPLKNSCGKEEVMQLGDVSRKLGRHVDGEKVVIVNLEYLSA